MSTFLWQSILLIFTSRNITLEIVMSHYFQYETMSSGTVGHNFPLVTVPVAHPSYLDLVEIFWQAWKQNLFKWAAKKELLWSIKLIFFNSSFHTQNNILEKKISLSICMFANPKHKSVLGWQMVYISAGIFYMAVNIRHNCAAEMCENMFWCHFTTHT